MLTSVNQIYLFSPEKTKECLLKKKPLFNDNFTRFSAFIYF